MSENIYKFHNVIVITKLFFDIRYEFSYHRTTFIVILIVHLIKY